MTAILRQKTLLLIIACDIVIMIINVLMYSHLNASDWSFSLNRTVCDWLKDSLVQKHT